MWDHRGTTPEGLRRTGGRLWPDARQEQLLRAALDPGPRARQAWEQLGPDLDLQALDPGSARLLPLVWWNLRRLGVGGSRVAELEARYHEARARNEALLGPLAEGLRAFTEAGIPTIVLKGPALVPAAYPDPGLRPMSDIDLLVPLDRVAAATRTLQALGWAPVTALTPAMERLTHSVPFEHPDRVSVDLHWHVFEECCRPGDDDDLWASSAPATIAGVSTRALAPEDQLLQACAHGEKWLRVPGLRWIADAVLLIRGARIDWPRLVAHAVQRRFAQRMHVQLAYLRTAFEAPIPAEALARLAAAPVSRLERFEQRWGLRDRRRPWILVYWCNHLRAATGGLPATALTFPRYLQAVWRLDSVAQIPGAAAARLGQRITERWAPARRA